MTKAELDDFDFLMKWKYKFDRSREEFVLLVRKSKLIVNVWAPNKQATIQSDSSGCVPATTHVTKFLIKLHLQKLAHIDCWSNSKLSFVIPARHPQITGAIKNYCVTTSAIDWQSILRNFTDKCWQFVFTKSSESKLSVTVCSLKSSARFKSRNGIWGEIFTQTNNSIARSFESDFLSINLKYLSKMFNLKKVEIVCLQNVRRYPINNVNLSYAMT